MSTYQQKLDGLVHDFLMEGLSLREFQRAYSDCYADENADAGFSPAEVEYYGGIHEMAEWTAAAPTEEERGYGWLDESGFRSWLEVQVRNRSALPIDAPPQ
jgi:hypothetical protein